MHTRLATVYAKSAGMDIFVAKPRNRHDRCKKKKNRNNNGVDSVENFAYICVLENKCIKKMLKESEIEIYIPCKKCVISKKKNA